MSDTAPKRRHAHAGWDLLEQSAKTMRERQLIATLAHCFSAGRGAAGISECCTRMLGRKWHWIDRLADRFVRRTGERTRPRRRDIIGFLSSDRGLHKAFTRLSGHFRIRHLVGA